MTDQPPSATPGDIEAALENVRAGIAVPPPPPIVEPSRREDGRKGDWLGLGALLVAAAVLGGAIALFLPVFTGLNLGGNEDARRRIGELETRIGQLAAGGSNDAAEQSFRDLSTRLEGVEVRVRALEATAGNTAPPPPAAPDPALTDHVAALDSALGELRTRFEALEQTVAGLAAAPPPAAPPPVAPVPAPVPSVDTAALADLVARVDALGSELAAVTQRLAALETATPAQAQEIVTALDRRISELENADPGRAGRNAALALTVSRLGEAVASGRPFTAELAALKQVAPATLDLTPFEAASATGMPTVQRLAAQLEALDPAIRAGMDEDRGGDWLDRLWRGLGGLVTVRTTGEPAGDTPEDRLDRARLRLAEGDLRAAAGELDWLWGQARVAAQGWIDLAKTRIALDDALAALTLAILEDLSRP
ncbi:hypothetical protein sos41_03430 [Alphaproteobacteria bacterium SO-S41]|nr:hypothetical protein sos41_03430 [Alphaproteobacteria bacterium SO-S41]